MSKTKIGVAVLAALLSMSVGAGAAQAANFQAASHPAFISGEQVSPKSLTLGFEASQTANCESAGFAGFIEAATSSLELSPGFNECTAFGAAGTIATNECTVVLHPGSGSGDNWTGTFDVACPGSNKIVVTGNNCKVEIGAQSGRGPVTYEEVTAATPDEVKATFNATSVSYTKAQDGAGCGLSGTGAKTDGTVKGAVNLKAGDLELNPINFNIE